eukprot:SM000351S13219  [mRNA]  locus=s351:2999:9304:- [translate_table: standard]
MGSRLPSLRIIVHIYFFGCLCQNLVIWLSSLQSVTAVAVLNEAEASYATEWTDSEHESYLGQLERRFVDRLYKRQFCEAGVCGVQPARSDLCEDELVRRMGARFLALVGAPPATVGGHCVRPVAAAATTVVIDIDAESSDDSSEVLQQPLQRCIKRRWLLPCLPGGI